MNKKLMDISCIDVAHNGMVYSSIIWYNSFIIIYLDLLAEETPFPDEPPYVGGISSGGRAMDKYITEPLVV